MKGANLKMLLIALVCIPFVMQGQPALPDVDDGSIVVPLADLTWLVFAFGAFMIYKKVNTKRAFR